MTDSASLALIKGAKKTAVDAELASPAVEQISIDLDSISGEELDNVLKLANLTAPVGWVEWDDDKKKNWLQAQGEQQTDPGPQVTNSAETQEPKKTKAKKGKAVVKSDVKHGEIAEPDLLQDLVHEIENTKKETALELIGTLTDQTEVTFFKLGGLLSVIQSSSWYEPYPSFREYVENAHGLAYRRAMHWIEIYNKLAGAAVSWAKVQHLGWTKLSVIAKVLTHDNVDEWVKVAESQTVLNLAETVKNSLSKDKAIEDQTAKVVTTLTFKVHEDQKETVKAAIAKAKEQSNTSVDTVALEYIALDFLGGQTLKDRLKAAGIEAALQAVEEAFPGVEITATLGDEAA